MRLLIVEDSERLQRSLRLGLRKAGYAVDICGDGEQALWQLQTVEYDAVILDIMLPSRDGLSVLQELRKKGNLTHILILTAQDAVEDRVKGLQLGADDYLVKPFAFEELLARVQALCRRNYAKKSPLLTFEGVEVNLATREVMVEGKPLELLPREFRLLEYLVIRQGEVVSRTDIESKLYGDETEVMSNVVESTVCQLRRKLELLAAKIEIKTRRGLGYCLQPLENGSAA